MSADKQIARDRRRRIVPERQADLFQDFPTLGSWRRWRPTKSQLQRIRKTKTQRRNEASRRNPQQGSIFGPGHTDELTGW